MAKKEQHGGQGTSRGRRSLGLSTHTTSPPTCSSEATE